jgi:hypothetical protein
MDARVESAVANSALVPASADLRLSFSDRATVLIIRTICISGLLLANYYSWSMTVTGFVGTKFLPDNSVLPNTYIPHVVAGFVQLGILAFYLSVPYFHRQRFFICTVASAFAISLIGLSALFALFSITLTSQSTNIVGHQLERLKGLNKQIVDLDASVVNTFQNQIKELETQHDRACDGKDRTQIKKCGPISTSYIEKGNAIRDKYGSQLNTKGTYELPAGATVMDELTSLRSNYVKLTQKIEVYGVFSNEQNLPENGITQSFGTLGREISFFEASLHERNPDAKTLVLTRVFDDLGRILRGNAESISYFALFISLLPDMLSATFTSLLLILRSASHESVVLRRAASKAYEEAKLYDKLGGAVELHHRAKQRWRERRRAANVAEAVDASVPDFA